MARSTIQEKLAGKGSMNLPQILAIVDALADYAQMNDAPLPRHEVDRETWQDRVAAASKESFVILNKRADKGATAAAQSIEWNIEPLRQAQMDDLVDMIQDYRSKPVGDWLPRVLRVMTQAEMSITDFLKKAAEDSPQGVVNTVVELHKEFPYQVDDDPWGNGRSMQNVETVGRLIYFSAMRHGDSAAPAIVVGLRRSYLGVYVEEFLTRVATWFLPPSIEDAVDQLRAAALQRDVEPVLKAISQRNYDRIYEVVDHFSTKQRTKDLNTIFEGIGSRKSSALRMIINDFQRRNAPDGVMWEIARGVAYSDYEEYIERFAQWGNHEFADLLHKASEEPPF
ncbi:hypothetical protein [Streptomyces sp. Caat 7-52]|uniref:hypothetical protein n=1 Tax=Streptomyces sp. Caat 7-52 TaxID=2949637 RepID=UPI0020356129|nr:hypothetical protein [Streptomyces sp. Caat 7-52]